MAIYSGVVTQSTGGTVLTFTDTSVPSGSVTSRILTIYDGSGTLVNTINMGINLTATYNITTDVYLSFILTLIDGTGTHVVTVNFLSTAFYEIVFAPLIAAQNSEEDNFGLLFNLNRAELFKESAMIFAIRGIGANAQANITQANFYLTTPYYA